MKTFDVTDRTTVRRQANRARYDRETVYSILDAALYCHVGFVVDDEPVVIPTVHARIDDELYLHGATGNRMLRTLGSGGSVCVTATLIDGLVLARTAFHHSVNYRSVVVLGTAREVVDPEEKIDAFRALVEQMMPGRWSAVRQPNESEIRRTLVVALPLVEASAKIRSGPPLDEEADLALDAWAGEVPFSLVAGSPTPSPDLAPGIEVPDHVVEQVSKLSRHGSAVNRR